MTVTEHEPVSMAPGETAGRIDTLAGELRAEGTPVPERWESAFRRTYRHLLVPRFHVWEGQSHQPNATDNGTEPRWRLVDGTDPDQYPEWRETVYRNQSLITDLTGYSLPPELGGGRAFTSTSSSTMPGLVLMMLDTLDVWPGQRVLEIGTGTGYNAALLCGMVGDGRVTSIDIAAHLTMAAGQRLSWHGLHPALVTGDGHNGVPERAPYERLVATTSVARIPEAWVHQTLPGGLILATVDLPLAHGAQVLLRVQGNGVASGRFQPGYASFMAARSRADAAYSGYPPYPADTGEPQEGVSTFDPRSLHTDDRWPFFASLALGPVRARHVFATDDTVGTRITAPDGAVATCWHTDRDWPTEQAGPRRLWDLLDAAHQQWQYLGHPGWEECTLSVTPGEQVVRVGENGPRFPLRG